MASPSQKLILFAALILTFASIPTSTAHRRRWRRSEEPFDDTEQYIRDLCDETDRADVCRNILQSDAHRFESSDEGEIAAGVIDLAIEKSAQIGDQLNQWYEDSNDDRMREKYHSCADNYYEANRYLEDAQRSFDSDGFRRITDQIDGSEDELDQCRQVFEDSPDPGHVGDRINEFALYLDMVRAATARFEYYDY